MGGTGMAKPPGGAGGAGGPGAPGSLGPPVVGPLSEVEEPLAEYPHPTGRAITREMIVTPAALCRFLTLRVVPLVTPGDTRPDILFIAMSHPHSECLPVCLSTASWDTLDWGNYF